MLSHVSGRSLLIALGGLCLALAPGANAVARSVAAQPTLHRPSGLAVDSRGDVYVADRGANRIMLFSPAGGLLAFWGTKGSRLNQFKSPRDVALDGRGRMYVSDFGNKRIVVLDASSGNPITVWGNTATRSIFEPDGIAADRAGNVYLADGQNQWIEKYSPTGRGLARLGSFPNPGQGQFIGPSDVALDARGNLYVTDYNWVTKLSPSGRELHTFGAQHMPVTYQFPSGVAVDRAGNIYIADTGNNRVVKLSAGGKRLAVFGGRRSKTVHFNNPTDVAVGGNGSIFVADTFNGRVVKLSPSGAVQGIWR